MNALLLLGGGFLAYQLLKGAGSEFIPAKYRLSFAKGKAIVYVQGVIQNPGGLPYTLDRLNFQLRDGENIIATAAPDLTVRVEENSKTPVEIPFILKGAALIDLVIKQERLGRPLRLTGEFYINGIRKGINQELRAI